MTVARAGQGWWAVLLGAAMAGPLPARSFDYELGIGPVDEIDGVDTVVATAALLTEQQHPWEFLIGHFARRDDDASISARTPNTTFLAISKRLVWRNWFVSSGLAVVDVDNEVLSGYGQFMTGAGWSNGRFGATLRHISNANTSGRNRGETFLLLHWRW